MRPKRIDPLLCDLDLALSGTFHPAGFPLRIATNSPHVLAAAAESWAAFDREFDMPLMEFRVVVEAAGDLAREPRFRKQLHLLSFVSDANNFATGDSLTLSATFHLSAATAANHVWLRWFYLESMAYMLLTQRYVVSLHAACVARDGVGILLCRQVGLRQEHAFLRLRARRIHLRVRRLYLAAARFRRPSGHRQAAPVPLPSRRRAALPRTRRLCPNRAPQRQAVH